MKKPDFRAYGAVGLPESPAVRSWAVVTGASDGIGYQFALQLALKGFNIFAISRSEDKLKALADKIMGITNNKVVCETYTFDLCTRDDVKWKQLIDKIESFPTDVGIVVNNAGVNQSYPEFFALTDDGVIQNILDLNIVATVKLTKGVLPLLLRSSDTCKKRLVLNIGSFAGLFPTPLLSTYSGSKSFLITWGASLSHELAGTDVRVETLVPYYVTTKLSKIRKSSMLIPSPEKFVQSAINRLGKSTVHSPYPFHAWLFWLVGVLPKKSTTHLACLANSRIRKLALKKIKSQ